MRRVCLVALLVVSAAAGGQNTPAAPPGDVGFEAVSRRLSAIETLRAQFTQTRQIPALSQPLHSRGRLIISGLGLYWEQSEPFKTVLIANADGLAQKIADQPVVSVSVAEQPMAVSISEVFLSIFRGDRRALDEYFDVDFDSNGEAWTIRLVPRTFPLTEAVASIVVEGTVFLDRLSVQGVAEDLLTVEFSDQRSEPTALSREERELYIP
ncbi:outer membrane lipoprotein carrier protein LolA [Candidatus Rariloculus sp.]|uniref:outer membrane lipoprotein carrier protein LolA n=1 Tax=Candidatus Rariloculus sp. TaxID=3101265 RepID=UPI003D148E16